MIEWMENFFWSWMLVFLRASSFLLILPLFSVRQMPVAVRIALAGIFAYLVNLTGIVSVVMPDHWMDTIFLMAIEIGTGLLMGFFIRLIFYGFEMAGQIITMETGMAMSTMFNPFEGQNSAVFSSLLFYFSVIIFLSLDLHHEVVAAFFHSYNVLPIGGAVITDELAGAVIRKSVQLFWVALEMAAPIICVSFTVTLMFAVFGRAVPQMNVFILSFPIRVMAGISIFGLSTTLFASYIQGYISAIPNDITNLIYLMAGQG